MSEYSIAIRTLGTAGSKYQCLLDSIKKSKKQPKAVYVVLPIGYAEPEEKLGNEIYLYSDKGMVSQRLKALEEIDTEYVFFVDDDICFDEDFIDRLLTPLENGLFDCSAGPLLSFFPQSRAGTIIGTLTSSCAVSVFHRNRYVNFLRSGGWSYTRIKTGEEKYYPTDSFAGTCFMVKTIVAKNIGMFEELWWLGKHGYEYGEDQIFAKKLKDKGYTACIVSNAEYEHLDGQTSKIKDETYLYRLNYTRSYFNKMYWYKFIYKNSTMINKVLDRVCRCYYDITMLIYVFLRSFKNRDILTGYMRGKKEADLDIRFLM